MLVYSLCLLFLVKREPIGSRSDDGEAIFDFASQRPADLFRYAEIGVSALRLQWIFLA